MTHGFWTATKLLAFVQAVMIFAGGALPMPWKMLLVPAPTAIWLGAMAFHGLVCLCERRRYTGDAAGIALIFAVVYAAATLGGWQ